MELPRKALLVVQRPVGSVPLEKGTSPGRLGWFRRLTSA